MMRLRPVHHRDAEAPLRAALRWGGAALTVALFTSGGVYAAMHWPGEALPPIEPAAAIMVDLAPMPLAPDTPTPEVALGPQMQMSEAATPSEQEDKPEEPEIAPVPENEKAVAVLPQAQPKPEPKRQPDKPRKARRKPQDRRAQSHPMTAAPKAAEAPRAAVNAAAMAGDASSVSPSTWRSMIMAHLNRYKRPPAGGGRGTVTIAITIDRAGRVSSARVAGSSGDAALDQEAVALARRASPVPAPPQDVGSGAHVVLVTPVRFSQ